MTVSIAYSRSNCVSHLVLASLPVKPRLVQWCQRRLAVCVLHVKPAPVNSKHRSSHRRSKALEFVMDAGCGTNVLPSREWFLPWTPPRASSVPAPDCVPACPEIPTCKVGNRWATMLCVYKCHMRQTQSNRSRLPQCWRYKECATTYITSVLRRNN